MNLAGVITAALRGEEFRIQQKRQVMYRNDRVPVSPKRGNEIRRVQQVQAVGPGLHSQSQGFKPMVCWRPAIHAGGVGGEGFGVAPPVEVGVGSVPVARGKPDRQMADISGNAAARGVGQPHVETESHSEIILVAAWERVSRANCLVMDDATKNTLYNPRHFQETHMEIERAAKTIQWLDDERRKDKQELVALQERITALVEEQVSLNRKLQQLETDLVTVSHNLQRVSKMDSLLDGYRKEMTRQLEELEQRRAEAGREDDRLRKVERDGITKSLADLRKTLEVLPRLEREAVARKEEENRVARSLGDLQLRVAEFNKHVDERNRVVTVLDEGRRQDLKRIVELQTETAELRRRLDDNRGKLDIVEDLARRTDVRIGELSLAETERRSVQVQWLDAQAIAQAERDRAWSELEEQLEASLHAAEAYAHRVEQYAETFRDMKRAADESRAAAELNERRIAESAEIQRLAEERFRQDWAAFLADDQKRWSTHMLLRDEQWREQDRLTARQIERLDNLEEQSATVADALHQLQVMDASRLQSLLNFVRDMAAEYDQSYAKVR